MKNIFKLFISCCIIAVTSTQAFADVKVTNHSKANATADANNPTTSYSSPCSSFLGASGIMTPNGTVTIPDWAISMTCSPKCNVNVYMDNTCKARKIATITVSPTEGLGEPNNLPNADGFYVSKKSKNELTIEGGAKADIFDMMFRKLGV